MTIENPLIQRLSHVSLGVEDIEKMIAFYTETFGFDVAHEFMNDTGERYGVFLHMGQGTFLELFRDAQPPSKGGRFRHFCLEVLDIEQAASNIRARGYEIEIKRGRTDGILQFFVLDPEANMIELQEHDGQSKLLPFVSGSNSLSRQA